MISKKERDLRDTIWHVLINNLEDIEDSLLAIEINPKDEFGNYRPYKEILADIQTIYGKTYKDK